MTKEDKIDVKMLLQLNLPGASAGYVIPIGYARVPGKQVTRA